MSALGQKRTLDLHPMSALPPKADIDRDRRDVRFVPKADMPATSGSLISVPILKEGAIIGAVNLYRREVRPFA